jgi:hypothetical protein
MQYALGSYPIPRCTVHDAWNFSTVSITLRCRGTSSMLQHTATSVHGDQGNVTTYTGMRAPDAAADDARAYK